VKFLERRDKNRYLPRIDLKQSSTFVTTYAELEGKSKVKTVEDARTFA
jgi:hypothetical protein